MEKMKRLKKVLAVILAAAMSVSLGAVSLAAPADTTLKVDPVAGHTYTAYQLFVGDLAADGETLSNVKWGSNAASSVTYKKDGADVTISPVAGEAVPQEVLEYLAGLDSKTDPQDGTPEAAAQDTADIISAWVAGTGTAVTADGITVKTGYYVVKDTYTDPAADQTTTLSTVVCEVVGPTTITPKAGTTEHKKEVLDINDTTDPELDFNALIGVDDSKWDKSADHDFGDHVPFRLTTTIGSDFAKYDSYYLAVSDTLKDGLKLDQDSILVYVDGELATEGTGAGQYSLTAANKSFKVEFTKLNGNEKAAAGKDVVIVYTATLDADTAVIGNPGNWNESYAEFSNNPNGDQSGKGKTPVSTAVVFTYKTEVDKVEPDGDGTKPLKGAEFTLTKKLKNGETVVAVIKYDENGNVTTKTADGTATSQGDATKFSFNGLDDGVYTLTETVTPNGYNTIAPVTFMIAATHTNSVTNGITSLEVKNEDGSAFTGDIEFTKIADSAGIATSALNQKGTVLPTTGGIGTTMFYIIGSILVIGAGVVLVARRRMQQ